MQFAQGEDGGDPRLRPTDLNRPRAPTGIAVRAKIFPLVEVERAEPSAVEQRVRLAPDLDPHKKFRKPRGHSFVLRIARGRKRLLEPEESEIYRIEQIRDRVAILLDQRRLRRAVFRIGPRGMVVAHFPLAEFLPDCTGRILRPLDVGGDALEPRAVLRPVVHAHEPGQREQHAAPLLLDPVGPPPAVRISRHHHLDSGTGLLQQRTVMCLVVQPEISGPDPSLIVGLESHGVGLPVFQPARGHQFGILEPPTPETVFSRRPEITEDVLHEHLVPAVAAQHAGRAQTAENGLHIVVVVERLGILGGPEKQAVIGLGRVVLENARADVNPVEQIARHLAAAGLAVQLPSQGKRQGGLAV